MDEHITERDYRCPACARLNFRGYLAAGSFVRMKCPRCKAWMVIHPNKKPMIEREPAQVDSVVICAV